MFKNLGEHIRHCRARALDAHQNAAATGDPTLKANYEAMEQGWLQLAENYALSERLQRYLLEQDSKIAKLGEWQSVALAPFDRSIELAVVCGATPHAVAFPCRRILHGWLGTDSNESIDVQPTHWREWL